MNELDIAVKAVQIYAETHPRPSHVSTSEAARMLGTSPYTVRNMIKTGFIKKNRLGKIPITEIDRAVASSRAI